MISCNRKVENKCTEIDDEPNNTPPGVGLSFAMCPRPLSQKAYGFQLLVDPGSSKHLINPELIRGVESRMLEYTAARNNVLRGTAQGILVVVVRVSLLISLLRLNLVLTYGITPDFRGGVHLVILNRHTPLRQSRVYRVTQLRTDSVHC